MIKFIGLYSKKTGDKYEAQPIEAELLENVVVLHGMTYQKLEFPILKKSSNNGIIVVDTSNYRLYFKEMEKGGNLGC